jgi:16S rRNA (adenine1518-N6/adenine1519-N6)-dimethyltransferase
MYTLKKSLGQHFLTDKNVIQNIIHVLQKTPAANLLEVGPGAGALTDHLIKLPGINFKAVEIDTEKAGYLLNKYPFLKEKIIVADILNTVPPFDAEFTVIGNFPYNISTQIIFKIIDWQQQVPFVIGMFQKEVAERIASKQGSKVYGVISVLIQYYYRVEYLFDVPKESFKPPPKVTSGVIKLSRLNSNYPVKSDRAFKLLVKTAFNQRRKTLRNAVRSLFMPEFLTDDLFNRRAETLSVEEFANLTFNMQAN